MFNKIFDGVRCQFNQEAGKLTYSVRDTAVLASRVDFNPIRLDIAHPISAPIAVGCDRSCAREYGHFCNIQVIARYNSVDESINLEHGDIVVLAVFECWEASTLFSKIDITVS